MQLTLNHIHSSTSGELYQVRGQDCNLRLLVRNTQENSENEHRVCNIRLLVRNAQENTENEHRVCNIRLLVRNNRKTEWKRTLNYKPQTTWCSCFRSFSPRSLLPLPLQNNADTLFFCHNYISPPTLHTNVWVIELLVCVSFMQCKQGFLGYSAEFMLGNSRARFS